MHSVNVTFNFLESKMFLHSISLKYLSFFSSGSKQFILIWSIKKGCHLIHNFKSVDNFLNKILGNYPFPFIELKGIYNISLSEFVVPA